MHEIIIDEEFKNLIPPLETEEREQLETNILGDGIREPLIVWKGENILVDGHNRYEIAQQYGIEFEVIEMEFGSRDEAKLWMIQNQIGRRNLNSWDRTRIMLKLKPSIQGKSPDVRETLANMAGVSSNTVSRVEYLQNHASEETLNALDAGEISINKAYTETKPTEKPDFTIKEDSVDRRQELLDKLPIKESKIGLPYQDLTIRCIKDIRDGDIEQAIDKVVEILKEPAPATMALARILLMAME